MAVLRLSEPNPKQKQFLQARKNILDSAAPAVEERAGR